MLMLSGLHLLDGLGAGRWFESVWRSSIGLRAAQFVILAAGLLADNARLVGLLQRHERGLKEQLARETELAVRAAGQAAVGAGHPGQHGGCREPVTGHPARSTPAGLPRRTG